MPVTRPTSLLDARGAAPCRRPEVHPDSQPTPASSSRALANIQRHEYKLAAHRRLLGAQADVQWHRGSTAQSRSIEWTPWRESRVSSSARDHNRADVRQRSECSRKSAGSHCGSTETASVPTADSLQLAND